MLRRVKNSNISNVYDVEFYEYEKVFNSFPITEEEEENIVEDTHIIYDGGGVAGWDGGCK